MAQAQASVPGIDPEIQALCDNFRRDYKAVQTEIAKAIVGHEAIVDGVLTCLFVGGHALLEGVPGLGKTALIRALADALSLKFSRIQFTPDLMPADVIGTNVIMENEHGQRAFTFMSGPIFAQIVLADEINRATPKTQSAMLEAMQEKQVTAGGSVRPLERPFFVMATQNPLEQEGTYPLPEAQLDRFFYKLIVEYSGREELKKILDMTTTGYKADIQPVIDGARIMEHQKLIQRVVIAPHVQDYAIRCVLATHPQGMFAIPMVNQYFRVGASPRAAQAITLAAKVRALLAGRFHVSFQDIKEVTIPAMRHRVILNFEGEAEGVTTDQVLERVIADTPTAMEAEMAAAQMIMATLDYKSPTISPGRRGPMRLGGDIAVGVISIALGVGYLVVMVWTRMDACLGHQRAGEAPAMISVGLTRIKRGKAAAQHEKTRLTARNQLRDRYGT